MTATKQKKLKPTTSLRIWRHITGYFFLIITALLCLLAIVYSSPWGSQLAVKSINKFTDVSLNYTKGMLSETIEFSSVTYKNSSVAIKANNVSLRFNVNCIWNKKLCINLLTIKKLHVKQLVNNVSTSEVDSTEKNSPSNFSLKSKQVSIEETNIQLLEHTITIENLKTSLDIAQNTLKFIGSSIDDITVIGTSKKPENAQPELTLHTLHQLKLPDINLSLGMQFNAFKLNKLVLQLDGEEQSSELTNIQLNANWTNNKIQLTNFQGNINQFGNININGELTTADNYPLNLNVGIQSSQNKFWPQLKDSTQTIRVKGDTNNLTLQLTSKGSLVLSADAEIGLLREDLPYQLDIQATKLPLYTDVSNIVHPSTLSVQSKGNIFTQQFLVNSIINGAGYKNADLTLSATHTKNKHSDSVLFQKLLIEEFSLKDNNNDVKVNGKITFDNKPKWDIKLNAKTFTLPVFNKPLFSQTYTGTLKGTLNSNGVFDLKAPVINVSKTNLIGNINDIPFAIKGELFLNKDWRLNPSNLFVSIYNSELNLKGYNDTQWFVDGLIDTPNISKFLPELKGNVATTFNIRGPIDNPVIHFKQDINNLIFKDTSTDSIKVQGSYIPNKNHQLSAQVKSQRIDWFDLELKRLSATIDANLNTQHIEFKWDGNLNTALVINGIWNNKDQKWTGKIDQTQLSYLDLQWLPDKTIVTEFDYKNKQVTVNNHCWNNKGFNLCLPETVSFFDRGEVPLIFNLDTSLFSKPFIPEDIQINSTIEGNVLIKWSPNKDYTINGDLDVLAGNIILEDKKFGLPTEILSAWDKGTLNFKFNDEFAYTHLILKPDNANKAAFYSTIDIEGNIKFTDNLPLSGTVNIDNFNLRPFQSVSHDITTLEGILHSNTQISGTVKKPKINGKITLNKGKLGIIKSPTEFKNINAKIDFQDDYGLINGSFNINDDIATIAGDAYWQEEKLMNLSIDAEKLSILIPPQIKTEISPHLTAKLTENSLKISGDINVLDGLLEIKKLPEGSVGISKDVVFVDRKGKEILKEVDFNIESNIRVIINEKFKLSGQGFDGSLAGDLYIQQSNTHPLQIFGNLTIPSGRYNAYGQKLQVEKGKISFNGPTDNPRVDFRATRTIPKESVKVGVEISGLANALALKLVSSPTMSQSQTLSYLIRGQSLNVDSPNNSNVGVALGAALANYSGILKQMEKLPLVNNLEIEGDSAQVSIAGYIGKNVYLKYGIGVEEPINELTIRLFLMSRLWIETISGLENSADIYYSFDTNL